MFKYLFPLAIAAGLIASAQTVSVSPPSITFHYVYGSPDAPQPQILQVMAFTLPVSAADVSISIGGVPAQIVSAEPALNGLANTSLLVVTCIVPDGLASGPQPLLLQVGEYSNSKQQVTIFVQ